MKKLIAITVGALLIGLVGASAEEKKDTEHKKPTPEQKQFHKQMIEKYDANKDGKLDKEERAKMTSEDKKKMEELFPHHKGEGKKGEGEHHKKQ